MSANPMPRRAVAPPTLKLPALVVPPAPPEPPTSRLPAPVFSPKPPEPSRLAPRPVVAQDNVRVVPRPFRQYEDLGDLPLSIRAMALGDGPDGDEAAHEGHAHHSIHTGHVAADGLKAASTLGREAAEILEHLVVIVGKSNTEKAMLREVAALLAEVPAPIRARALDLLRNPLVREVLLPGLHTIARSARSAVDEIARLFPRLARSRVTAIVMEQAGKALGRALPLVGAGIAGWGTTRALDAAHDPRLSAGTKLQFALANALDWGAAAGGVLAETGVGELAALGAAGASILVWSKAEASREMDLQTHGERKARALWQAIRKGRPQHYLRPAPSR